MRYQQVSTKTSRDKNHLAAIIAEPFADRAGSPVSCKAKDVTPHVKVVSTTLVTAHNIKGVQAEKRLPLPVKEPSLVRGAAVRCQIAG